MGQPLNAHPIGTLALRSGAPVEGPLRDQGGKESASDCDTGVVLNLHRVRSKDHYLIPTQSAPKANDLWKEHRLRVLSIGMSISAGNSERQRAAKGKNVALHRNSRTKTIVIIEGQRPICQRV